MDEIKAQYETNFFGLIRVTHAVLTTMRSQKSGAIVNISSGAGRFGFPSGSAYASTKFAVEGLSESISYELEPFGIKVVIVESGVIRTTYGESIAKPIIIGAITIGLSTLFWLMQSNLISLLIVQIVSII
jgi:short-subunit dehydrogenase